MSVDSPPHDPAARAIITALNLARHPEGGWFAETYRAPAAPGERPVQTVIHFLLEAGQRSHWHRVDAVETWCWHAGSPISLLHAPGDAGPVACIRLGGDVLAGEAVHHVIPADHWQAAEAGEGWALVSCLVAPGFDFAGFTLAAPGWQPGN